MKVPENIILSEVCPNRNLIESKSIAVHLHIFYPEMADDLAIHLANIPVPFDLYMSVPETITCDEAHLKEIFSNITQVGEFCLERTPNKGRDIAPMLCTFGKQLMEHDIIMHMHTKKSPHDSQYSGWMSFITEHLLSSKKNLENILTLLSTNIGIIAPPDYIAFTNKGGWQVNSNIELAQQLLNKAGINRNLKLTCPVVYYPQGSMFWARTDYLKPLFNLGLSFEDFPEEPIPTDGTIAHAIERIFFLCGENTGRKAAYIYNNTWQAYVIKYFEVLGKKKFKHLKHFQIVLWIDIFLLLVIAVLLTLLFR